MTMQVLLMVSLRVQSTDGTCRGIVGVCSIANPFRPWPRGNHDCWAQGYLKVLIIRGRATEET